MVRLFQLCSTWIWIWFSVGWRSGGTLGENMDIQKKKRKKRVKYVTECLVIIFNQQFSVFKQHFTYFYIFFHPHIFLQKFLNNNFQFLNTCTKRTLNGWTFPNLFLSVKGKLGFPYNCIHGVLKLLTN